MFAIWLHAYPDSTPQAARNLFDRDGENQNEANLSKARRRLPFPQPDWFKQRVGSLPAAALHSHPGRQHRCSLQALAKVQVGSIWENELSRLNTEEFYGKEFFQHPSDFFSLHILSRFPLAEAVPVPEAKSLVLRREVSGVVLERERTFFNVQAVNATQPFLPYLPGISLSTMKLPVSGNALSAQEVLNQWGLDEPIESCLAVPLPETLFRMVVHGSWEHIPCLGRWHNLLHGVPEAEQRKVGWPGTCAPKAADGSLSQARLLELMDTVQSWAPILLNDDNNDMIHARKLQLTAAVRWLLNVRAAIPGVANGIAKKGIIYESLFLVKCMLMSRLMPAYVSWKQVCLESLSLLFPNLLKDSLQDLLERKNLFPGEGSKHKMRLVLDVALLLWKREKEKQEGPFVRFAGADSSPQHGRNWLLSSCVSVRQDKIVEVFHCVQRLIAECQRRSLQKSLGREEQEEESEQSCRDHATVHAFVVQEHDVPVVLGSGAESIANKCAAMLHKWSVFLGDSTCLPEHLKSFFSFCSDMGAELGIGHFHVENFMSLLPAWQRHEAMEVDLPEAAAVPGRGNQHEPSPEPMNLESDLPSPVPEQPMESALESDLPFPIPAQPNEPVDVLMREDAQQPVWTWQPPPSGDNSAHFLPNALVVPGLLHIVSNALVEVSGKLSYFETFFDQLGEFEGLVTCGRLVRFVNYCVRPSHFSLKADELLQRKFGRLYLKRWGEVVKFCKRLSEFLPLIRCVWDEHKYRCNDGGGQEEEGREGYCKFNPSRFTTILRDHMFFAYFDMVLHLSDAMERLAHWGESCPCHDPGFAGSCIMRGKRLPEPVAEGLDIMLGKLTGHAFARLMQRHKPVLTDAQWALLVADFESGKAHAELEFTLKLDFLRRLPWKFALLAHHDLALVRRELQITVHDFDAQPTERQMHHHSLVRHLLDKSSSMRAEMDNFLAGEPLEHLPKLEFYAACFRLVQVTERSFEASHDFAQAVKMHKPVLEEVATQFSIARHVKNLPGLVGLHLHPEIVQAQGQSGNKWAIVKRMNKVLYRADVQGQFPDVAHMDVSDQRQRQAAKGHRKVHSRKTPSDL